MHTNIAFRWGQRFGHVSFWFGKYDPPMTIRGWRLGRLEVAIGFWNPWALALHLRPVSTHQCEIVDCRHAGYYSIAWLAFRCNGHEQALGPKPLTRTT